MQSADQSIEQRFFMAQFPSHLYQNSHKNLEISQKSKKIAKIAKTIKYVKNHQKHQKTQKPQNMRKNIKYEKIIQFASKAVFLIYRWPDVPSLIPCKGFWVFLKIEIGANLLCFPVFYYKLLKGIGHISPSLEPF